MYIGIDIGGTNTRIGLFKNPTQLVKDVSFDTLQNFNEAKIQMIGKLKLIVGEEKISAIGVGVTGILDEKREKLVKSGSLPRWENKPLKQIFEKKLSIPVQLENDALVAALAEQSDPENTKLKKYLYIIWGTGVGGVYVEKMKEGLYVRSFSPGQQIIEWNGVNAEGIHKGSLSAYISGYAIPNTYGVKPKNLDEDLWNKIAQKTAQGLINTVVHYPVDTIIFSGGLIQKQRHLLFRISNIIKNRLTYYPVPDLRISKFGDKSGLVGAVSMFFVKRI